MAQSGVNSSPPPVDHLTTTCQLLDETNFPVEIERQVVSNNTTTMRHLMHRDFICCFAQVVQWNDLVPYSNTNY
jgi:hypothetical protein